MKRYMQALSHLVQAARHERGLYGPLSLFSNAWALLATRWAARLRGWPRVSLGSGARTIGTRAISIGPYSAIKRHAWLEAIFQYNGQVFNPRIVVGSHFLASERLHVSCVERVEIGDNCLFGSGVYISDHNHGAYRGSVQSPPTRAPKDRALAPAGPVVIKSNVWLGDNVVIVGPVTLGHGCIVGANSVVTRDVPDHVMAAGAPLKLLKQYNHQTRAWERLA